LLTFPSNWFYSFSSKFSTENSANIEVQKMEKGTERVKLTLTYNVIFFKHKLIFLCV